MWLCGESVECRNKISSRNQHKGIIKIDCAINGMIRHNEYMA